MLLILILGLSMMLFATVTAAAEPEPAAPSESPAAAASPAPPSPEDLAGKKVAFVEVAGAVNVRPDLILAATRLKPGDEWTADKVRQDLRLIY